MLSDSYVMEMQELRDRCSHKLVALEKLWAEHDDAALSKDDELLDYQGVRMHTVLKYVKSFENKHEHISNEIFVSLNRLECRQNTIFTSLSEDLKLLKEINLELADCCGVSIIKKIQKVNEAEQNIDDSENDSNASIFSAVASTSISAESKSKLEIRNNDTDIFENEGHLEGKSKTRSMFLGIISGILLTGASVGWAVSRLESRNQLTSVVVEGVAMKTSSSLTTHGSLAAGVLGISLLSVSFYKHFSRHGED